MDILLYIIIYVLCLCIIIHVLAEEVFFQIFYFKLFLFTVFITIRWLLFAGTVTMFIQWTYDDVYHEIILPEI